MPDAPDRDAWTPERIRALRSELNLTGAEMAKRLGIQPRGYRRLEQSPDTPTSSRPSGPVLVLLAQLRREAEARRARRAKGGDA